MKNPSQEFYVFWFGACMCVKQTQLFCASLHCWFAGSFYGSSCALWHSSLAHLLLCLCGNMQEAASICMSHSVVTKISCNRCVWYCASFTSSDTHVATVFNIFKSCHKIQGTVARKCKNPGCYIVVATTFFMVVPNIFGSSIWNSLCTTLLTSRILR